MTKILTPQQGILFMKVGVHANESLEDIIQRKTLEIEQAGFALWGYGGNTCHPGTMVQPFAKMHQAMGGKILLCMQEMESHHFADPVRAEQYSVDGVHWQDVPQAINVLGSRFALAIKDLHEEKFVLPLDKTRVAVGHSKGVRGHNYIAGRVDKACLDLSDQIDIPSAPEEVTNIQISLVAELCDPYAVFLKN
ncbi:MAG: hypothetical protein KKG03_03445 [Gammaproteobacteria bacterium]|nr:hypothetical protein [Sideroxydans sp.]MBU4150687.1 hypothetical protein [Gammaproteobacteria bacterium]